MAKIKVCAQYGVPFYDLKKDGARTGDERSMTLWIALLAAGLAGFGYAWSRLRRE